jgi:hypothetical protein
MTSLTKKQIDWLDKCAKGRWTLNPKTGFVDVDGGFNCSSRRLKGFKGVKFGRVSGSFDCDYNSLTSLEGAPQEVGVSFDCDYNSLTSLEGAPQEVGSSFYCSNNSLTSLVGAPQSVGENFFCSNNSLTSLVGAPQEVGGHFKCDDNRLISLVGAPQSVGGYFSCEYNRLTSLVGATLNVRLGLFSSCGNPVSGKTLVAIFRKMQEGHSFVIAAASLRNEMSKTSWKFIAPHIPDAIRPGVSMLARFGVI